MTLGGWGGDGTCTLSLPHGCPPTALAGREPTQPEGMCSATLSGNKPAAAERPQGPARGTAPTVGTVGTWGAEPQLGNRGRRDGVGGERVQGPGAICSSPARVPVGRGPARAGTPTAGNGRGAAAGLSPLELESFGGARAGLASHPAPQEARAVGTGTRWGSAWTLSPPSCLPPARRAPAPLKGALRGPAAYGGAARGSAAENTGTSP